MKRCFGKGSSKGRHQDSEFVVHRSATPDSNRPKLLSKLSTFYIPTQTIPCTRDSMTVSTIALVILQVPLEVSYCEMSWKKHVCWMDAYPIDEMCSECSTNGL